jgi:hypothetical protein
MARQQTVRGLGLSFLLSRFLADTSDTQNLTASGASQASAAAIPPDQFVAYVNATNTGSGLILPGITGDFWAGNCDIGDDFTIINTLGASVVVYAKGNNTFIDVANGASTAGSVGVSVGSLKARIFMPISASTWAALT